MSSLARSRLRSLSAWAGCFAMAAVQRLPKRSLTSVFPWSISCVAQRSNSVSNLAISVAEYCRIAGLRFTIASSADCHQANSNSLSTCSMLGCSLQSSTTNDPSPSCSSSETIGSRSSSRSKISVLVARSLTFASRSSRLNRVSSSISGFGSRWRCNRSSTEVIRSYFSCTSLRPSGTVGGAWVWFSSSQPMRCCSANWSERYRLLIDAPGRINSLASFLNLRRCAPESWPRSVLGAVASIIWASERS